MEGHASAVNGPLPVLLTPCVREIFDVDTVSQRATLLLEVCIDWVDDGVLESVGSSGSIGGGATTYRLKDGVDMGGALFHPCVVLNNVIEEISEREEHFSINTIAGRPVLSLFFSQIVLVSLKK